MYHLSWCSCPPGNPPASSARQYLTPSLLFASPNREVPLPARNGIVGVSFTTLAMLLLVTASMMRSESGLPAPTITYQPPQATVWHGVPGTMGAPGQMAQLPHGVQLSPMPAPCPPAYGWGQQVVMGTLVPHQLMGLRMGAVVQEEFLFPTSSCLLHVPAHPCPLAPHHPISQHWVQGTPGLHTLPRSAQKPLEASDNDMFAIRESVPENSPHWPALPSSHSRTMSKLKGGFWEGGGACGQVSHAKESWHHPGVGLLCFLSRGDNRGSPGESCWPTWNGARHHCWGLSWAGRGQLAVPGQAIILHGHHWHAHLA